MTPTGWGYSEDTPEGAKGQQGLGINTPPVKGRRDRNSTMRYRWVDRAFSFTLPEELFPCIVERLRGTPARIEEKVRTLSPAILTRRDGNKWSIQEHLGHLLDLDELHMARLNDYLASAKVLRPGDMENKKTFEANYNQRSIEVLLKDFRLERQRFVERLDRWEERSISQTAIHSRLKRTMRVIDMAYFVAEHDDHHLARMTELPRLFSESS